MLKHKDRTLRSPDPLARRRSFCVHQFAAFCPSDVMYNTFSFCSRDHWNSESIPCLEVEVFDVSHNPELGGIIPEQIIVDWAEARPQKVFVLSSRLWIQDFWPKAVDYLAILNTTIAGYISSLCNELSRAGGQKEE